MKTIFVFLWMLLPTVFQTDNFSHFPQTIERPIEIFQGGELPMATVTHRTIKLTGESVKDATRWMQAIENACQADLYNEPLNSIQKTSIVNVLTSFEVYGDSDNRKLAYIFSSAMHETSLEPKDEYSGKKRSYGNTGFYGRGIIQMTGKKKYVRFGNWLDIDFVKNPQLANDNKNSAKIAVYGLIEGKFTGSKLASHINDKKCDFFKAGSTMNGRMKTKSRNERANRAKRILAELQKT
jgi:hypothetical protein